MELSELLGDVVRFLKDRVDAWRAALRGALLILGPAFVVIGAGSAILTADFLRASLSATGIVVSNLPQYDKENDSTSYTPVFSFQAADGKSYTVTGIGSSNPPEFQVGESVKVLYRAKEPAGARIASFWQLWGFAALFGAFGVGAGGAGYSILRYERWLGRKGLSLRGSRQKADSPRGMTERKARAKAKATADSREE